MRLTNEERDLVSKHLGLIDVSIRKLQRFSNNPGINISDLWQEGVIGLCKAAKKFDPTRGVRFSTYATYWILDSLRREIYRSKSIMHIPEKYHIILAQVNRIDALDRAKNGEISPGDKVASQIGESHNSVKKARTSRYEFSERTTLDGKINDAIDLIESDSDPEDEAYRMRIVKLVENTLEKVKPRAKKAFLLYFYGDMTLDEVGAELGVSRERIRQIKAKIISMIRAELEIEQNSPHKPA